MTTIADLFQLQQVDLSAAQARRRLLEIQAALQESDDLQQARQRVQGLQEERQGWQHRQREAELENQGVKAKITQTDELLMSGKVRNLKELEALQANLESLHRHVTLLDDRGVEALLHLEEVDGSLTTAETALQSLQAEWAQERNTLIQEGKQLQAQYNQWRQRRGQQAKAMDARWLALYENLRKRKAGVAVARIADASCGACFVSLPTGIISEARAAKEVTVYCPSCGRILFVG